MRTATVLLSIFCAAAGAQATYGDDNFVSLRGLIGSEYRVYEETPTRVYFLLHVMQYRGRWFTVPCVASGKVAEAISDNMPAISYIPIHVKGFLVWRHYQKFKLRGYIEQGLALRIREVVSINNEVLRIRDN